jgi:hypothetical protein
MGDLDLVERDRGFWSARRVSGGFGWVEMGLKMGLFPWRQTEVVPVVRPADLRYETVVSSSLLSPILTGGIARLVTKMRSANFGNRVFERIPRKKFLLFGIFSNLGVALFVRGVCPFFYRKL